MRHHTKQQQQEHFAPEFTTAASASASVTRQHQLSTLQLAGSLFFVCVWQLIQLQLLSFCFRNGYTVQFESLSVCTGLDTDYLDEEGGGRGDIYQQQQQQQQFLDKSICRSNVLSGRQAGSPLTH